MKKITSLPISTIYDAVATPDAQKALWEILAPNGKIAVVLPPAVGKPGQVSEDGKEIAWVFGSANAGSNYEFGKSMFAGITKLLESGELKVRGVSLLLLIGIRIDSDYVEWWSLYSSPITSKSSRVVLLVFLMDSYD